MEDIFDQVSVVQERLLALNVPRCDENRIYNLLEDEINNTDRIECVVKYIAADFNVFPEIIKTVPIISLLEQESSSSNPSEECFVVGETSKPSVSQNESSSPRAANLCEDVLQTDAEAVRDVVPQYSLTEIRRHLIKYESSKNRVQKVLHLLLSEDIEEPDNLHPPSKRARVATGSSEEYVEGDGNLNELSSIRHLDSIELPSSVKSPTEEKKPFVLPSSTTKSGTLQIREPFGMPQAAKPQTLSRANESFGLADGSGPQALANSVFGPFELVPIPQKSTTATPCERSTITKAIFEHWGQSADPKPQTIAAFAPFERSTITKAMLEYSGQSADPKPQTIATAGTCERFGLPSVLKPATITVPMLGLSADTKPHTITTAAREPFGLLAPPKHETPTVAFDPLGAKRIMPCTLTKDEHLNLPLLQKPQTATMPLKNALELMQAPNPHPIADLMKNILLKQPFHTTPNASVLVTNGSSQEVPLPPNTSSAMNKHVLPEVTTAAEDDQPVEPAQPKNDILEPKSLPPKEQPLPHKYLQMAKDMFPQVDILFLSQQCQSLPENASIDHLITILLDFPDKPLKTTIEVNDALLDIGTFPASEEDKCNAFETLQEILPDADPDYLRREFDAIGSDEQEMKKFVANALELRNYPTRIDYNKRQEDKDLRSKLSYTFNLHSFLEMFPDPVQHFSKIANTEVPVSVAKNFLMRQYPSIKCCDIDKALRAHSNKLFQVCEDFNCFSGSLLKNIRPASKMRNAYTADCDITCLQLMAYIEHKEEILNHFKKKNLAKEDAFKRAKEKGELVTCGCCFDEELVFEESVPCEDGHLFCRECVTRGAEVQIAQGKSTLACLTGCEKQIGFNSMKSVLKPSVFLRMVQRRTAEEVQAAGIEDFETCPFCDFGLIPQPEDKVFSCLNPQCLKQSCRSCRQVSHIPLRCSEVEQEEEVKARTYIEDKMTEALIRTCYKCKKKFIKEEGCNKMTCPCGALMCYLCRQPVQDYTHFNGQGGEEYHKCALFSNDDLIHVNAVSAEAMKAKEEITAQNPNIILKHDPTMVLPQPKVVQKKQAVQAPHQAQHRVPGNLPAQAQPLVPGNLPAQAQPRVPGNLPAQAQHRVPGNLPAQDLPPVPGNLPAQVLPPVPGNLPARAPQYVPGNLRAGARPFVPGNLPARAPQYVPGNLPAHAQPHQPPPAHARPRNRPAWIP